MPRRRLLRDVNVAAARAVRVERPPPLPRARPYSEPPLRLSSNVASRFRRRAAREFEELSRLQSLSKKKTKSKKYLSAFDFVLTRNSIRHGARAPKVGKGSACETRARSRRTQSGHSCCLARGNTRKLDLRLATVVLHKHSYLNFFQIKSIRKIWIEN